MRNSNVYLWAFIFIFGLLTACSDATDKPINLSESAVILAFGDSLTFGTGARADKSYPAQLAQLTGKTVINAGVPGETSSEGLKRLPDLLVKHNPDLVILCHGGNDFLRKLDQNQLEANIEAMIDLIQQSGAQVLLLAVPKLSLLPQASPIYQTVAQKKKVALDNDIIAKVESTAELKSDPIHPNAIGYKKIAEQLALWIN